jgi:hypothetical protein
MLVNTASTHSKQTGHKLIIVADHDKVFNSSINLNGTEVLYLRSLNEAFDWMNRISSGETKIPHISQVWVSAESIPVESISSTTSDESQSEKRIFTEFEPLVIFLCELFENDNNLMLSPDSFVLYGDDESVNRIKSILTDRFPANVLNSVDDYLVNTKQYK